MGKISIKIPGEALALSQSQREQAKAALVIGGIATLAGLGIFTAYTLSSQKTWSMWGAAAAGTGAGVFFSRVAHIQNKRSEQNFELYGQMAAQQRQAPALQSASKPPELTP